MFHSIDGMTVQEAQQANVRQFVGDGTPYLKVPGLKAVTAVRVGQTHIPMVISQKFPLDPDGHNMHTVESPMVIHQTLSDGSPVLLRSIQSNDGVWQKDEPIFVQGEWEDEPSEPASEPARDDKAKK